MSPLYTVDVSPQQKHPEGDASHRILRAAERLLRNDGGGGLSMRRLAAEAGVGHVAAYRRFESKRGVIDALVAEQLGPGLARIVAAPPATSIDGLFERQATLLQLVEADEPYLRALFRSLDDAISDEDRALFVDQLRERNDKDLQSLVEAGQLRHDAPLDVTARNFFIAIDGAVRRWFRGLSSIEELRRDAEIVTCHSLLAAAAPDVTGELHDRLRALAV